MRWKKIDYTILKFWNDKLYPSESDKYSQTLSCYILEHFVEKCILFSLMCDMEIDTRVYNNNRINFFPFYSATRQHK